MGDDDGRPPWVPAALAGLLGLCCVSLPALGGAAAVAGGTAGATAVTTGVSSLAGILVTVGVTLLTLVPVWLVLRWRYAG